jgi:FdhD protein
MTETVPGSEPPSGGMGAVTRLQDAHRRVRRLAWRNGGVEPGERALPEEAAVVLSYNRLSYAVMMASPADLEDFAIGFSLTEGIVRAAAEIEELTTVAAPEGLELRMWIAGPRMAAVTSRRRRLAGPTGCGLCGLESLAEAARPAPTVAADPRIEASALARAMREMQPRQELNRITRAVHAAAFWRPGGGILALREDVGRHNALDKLAGALARAGIDPGTGAILMTSRISVELVQKAAMIGVPVLAAISAPTTLALRMAEAAGMTVAGIARDDGFEVFTRGERITGRLSDAA